MKLSGVLHPGSPKGGGRFRENRKKRSGNFDFGSETPTGNFGFARETSSDTLLQEFVRFRVASLHREALT